MCLWGILFALVCSISFAVKLHFSHHFMMVGYIPLSQSLWDSYSCAVTLIVPSFLASIQFLLNYFYLENLPTHGMVPKWNLDPEERLLLSKSMVHTKPVLIFFFFAVGKGLIPSDAQSLLLTLCSEFIPGGLGEQLALSWVKSSLTGCKASILPTMLFSLDLTVRLRNCLPNQFTTFTVV